MFKIIPSLWISLLLILILNIMPKVSLAYEHDIMIGVLAKQGSEKCFEKWRDTAFYLETFVSRFKEEGRSL